jgi:hypothetical protein
MATDYPNLREYPGSDYARLPNCKIEALLEAIDGSQRSGSNPAARQNQEVR